MFNNKNNDTLQTKFALKNFRIYNQKSIRYLGLKERGDYAKNAKSEKH